jgi:hypothetical protein
VQSVVKDKGFWVGSSQRNRIYVNTAATSASTRTRASSPRSATRSTSPDHCVPRPRTPRGRSTSPTGMPSRSPSRAPTSTPTARRSRRQPPNGTRQRRHRRFAGQGTGPDHRGRPSGILRAAHRRRHHFTRPSGPTAAIVCDSLCMSAPNTIVASVPFARLKADSRRTRLAWGQCHAPIKSRQGHPDRRRATQRKPAGREDRQREKRVSSPPVAAFSSASDVADSPSQNSKREGRKRIVGGRGLAWRSETMAASTRDPGPTVDPARPLVPPWYHG